MFAVLAACARQPPRVDSVHLSVTTATEPCVVAGEEAVATVMQRCPDRVLAEERTSAPSLRVELVPATQVVPAGGVAHFAVRLTNAEQRPVRFVLNRCLEMDLRAADGSSTLAPAPDDRFLCPTSGLAVDLQPGATLRFDEEIEARRWVPMDPGPDANGFTVGPDPAWELGPALPSGAYTLEVDLPSIITADGSFMTVRGTLQVE